uniref:uncharacterized protein LOC122611347 n=1 Tax=Erigeron canadensis TaxID=72917 RepID=UPI001CB9CEA1|nr:uncharacterized protein LOC122611347 [Erigeron canadensis]
MQSRRHQNFGTESSYGRTRRDGDMGLDGYLLSPRRMEVPGYSERVLGRGRRSISLEKRRVGDDRSRRVRSRSRSPGFIMEDKRVVGGRRSVSLERRRVVEDRSRGMRSRSPDFVEGKRGRAYYNEEWVMERDLVSPERRSRYDFVERMDRKHEDVDYGRGPSRTIMIDDKFEDRRLDSGMREIGTHKSAGVGLYRSMGDVGPVMKSNTGGELTSASLSIGLNQLGKERVEYPDIRDSFSFDKSMANLRDSYSGLTASRSKESMGVSHFKDYERLSPRKSRVDELGYQSGIPLPRDKHPLNSGLIPDPLPHSGYEERHHLERGKDRELEINEDMGRYRHEGFSPPRTGHPDALRGQPRIRERDDFLYPSDEIYEKMNLREREDYSDRGILRASLLEPVTQRTEISDFARRNMSSRSLSDHLSLEKLAASNNVGLNRSPREKRETLQYPDPASIHSRLGRKLPREQEIPYMGMPQDHEIERIRVDYDYKRNYDYKREYDYKRDYDYNRDVGSGSHEEGRRSSPGFLYERTHKMEERDLSPYDSSSRIMKRKYIMEDEENRTTSRTMMSRLDTVGRRHNRDFYDKEWIDQDGRGSNFARRKDHTDGFIRRVDTGYDDEFLSYDNEEYLHDHPMKSYKHEDKYAKGYPRSGGRGGYNSYPSHRRHVHPNWKNAPIRREHDKEVDMYSGDTERYDPHEDTEKFKQLVHDYFLSFTKKLNDTPSVRRKYLEHGQAGSVYCIVCGRSVSKEFLDTQRLAMHAFMSHKVGMRAQHLGLVKALCVMLGWNSAIPVGTVRWFPETLSSKEAWVQKEDLIIWPPVVIVHNISITNNDSNGQGPTTIEALTQFLRGVGLSGGKVKHGKVANCSIMLVKFLGTFSGLQDAEKIHQYFVRNKHGRRDLDKVSSSKGKSSNSEEGESKEAERVLFGYMGIAEDLDKVNADTKKKCIIKSKKEIHEFADGPVKPE